jgi:Cof subfamily protein (haloacid dehalogenase superfamily)
MKYRLLALDLDGTLLRRDHTVDERDVGAIRELQAAGVTVTIVTGRLSAGATGAACACSIEGVIACIEGSHLLEVATGTTLLHHGMERDAAAVLRATLGAHGLASFVFDAAGIHHDHAAARYADYVRTWSPAMRIVEEELAWQTEPLAAVAIGDAGPVAAAHAALLAHADRLFTVSFPVYSHPGKHAVLVRATGTTKGTALAELCRRAGCSLAEAVAVGDWVNDIPMFEVAGRSFAMGSAPEAVRAKATDALACEAGAGGGIAEVVHRAWG